MASLKAKFRLISLKLKRTNTTYQSQRAELLKGSSTTSSSEIDPSSSSDVTKSLQNTLEIMRQELDRSVMSTHLLDLMKTSKALISSLKRADIIDRILLTGALTFFGLVCLYILKKRILDKGVSIISTLISPLSRMDIKTAKPSQQTQPGNINTLQLHPTFSHQNPGRCKGTVKIIVGQTNFLVHKQIMILASPFFESILTGKWAETSLNPEDNDDHQEQEEQDQDQTTTNHDELDSGSEPDTHNHYHTNPIRFRSNTSVVNCEDKIEARIVLEEEHPAPFQDLLMFVYPHLECVCTWQNASDLMTMSRKFDMPLLKRHVLNFLLSSVAGKPIEAMKIAEQNQLADLYRESSGFLLDNWQGWEHNELDKLSAKTLLKLEKRRTWFLEPLLKLGLVNSSRDYVCPSSCPDPQHCTKLVDDEWRSAWAASFKFGPPQPSSVYRALRSLEPSLHSPALLLPHTSCQQHALRFFADLFNQIQQTQPGSITTLQLHPTFSHQNPGRCKGTVEIIVGQTNFLVHKQIMIHASPFFESILTGEWAETSLNPEDNDDHQEQEEQDQDQTTTNHDKLDSGSEPDTHNHYHTNPIRFRSNTSVVNSTNKIEARIVLEEEHPAPFQDLLMFVLSSSRVCMYMAKCIRLAGKPIEAMKIAEENQLADLYRESSRFLLDNWQGWEHKELDKLSAKTLLKLEKRRTWFLERLLKLGLVNSSRDYVCPSSCPDPQHCTKLVDDKWRSAWAASFKFGPPQPSSVYRALRSLEPSLHSPALLLPHTSCQQHALRFFADLF
ncbi:hypothetical protein PSTT_06629 [Puccinia striiformis]|uniref:BTB domain-containing protein n=1 Tax=Puccinia striiformis TaxID=27350 RepID=A0A2S4VJL5_9BASI|nr:hypothetical protein PSTT_06629 [Puccinia striiformis]